MIYGYKIYLRKPDIWSDHPSYEWTSFKIDHFRVILHGLEVFSTMDEVAEALATLQCHGCKVEMGWGYPKKKEKKIDG